MTVYLDLEGKPTPSNELSWYFIQGNGFVDGSMYCGSYATAEAAHKVWTPRKRDRERELKQGLQIVLGRTGQGEIWDRMMEQWGIPNDTAEGTGK
jgi:hypothetical protein